MNFSLKPLSLSMAFAAFLAVPSARAADAVSAAPMAASGSTSMAAKSLSHADTSFMKEAAHAGSAEIESAQLAETKSSNPTVQDFAKQMVADHTEAAAGLKSLAASKGYELPADPTMMQKAKEKMLAMRSDSFDLGYAKMAVSDHEKAVALFRKASTGAKDSDVRAFATKTLPTLEHHLQMARELRASAAAKSN